jgi:hypothetical protein
MDEKRRWLIDTARRFAQTIDDSGVVEDPALPFMMLGGMSLDGFLRALADEMDRAKEELR